MTRRDAAAVLCLVGTLAAAIGCRSAPGPRPEALVLSDDRAHAGVEAAVHELVNAHRRRRGLPALTLDARVSRLARGHSTTMAAARRLGHDGFTERTKALGGRSPRAVAENVAYDRGHASPAQEIVARWLESRGHRENIEGAFDRTGVGVASNTAGEVYVTQIFVGTPDRGDCGVSLPLVGLRASDSRSRRSDP